jgi:hypothetical protein
VPSLWLPPSAHASSRSVIFVRALWRFDREEQIGHAVALDAGRRVAEKDVVRGELAEEWPVAVIHHDGHEVGGHLVEQSEVEALTSGRPAGDGTVTGNLLGPRDCGRYAVGHERERRARVRRDPVRDRGCLPRSCPVADLPNGNVQISQRLSDGHRRRIDPCGQCARVSADLLEQGHDDPFRPSYVGHPHAVLVLADAADEPVPVPSQLIDGRLEVADLE